uniref:DNA-directed DNA polymerase n=1 Tax=uncultured virus TaxID=340016 RepID=A0A219YK80_9VIRU|nr:DNA polymerase A [uncultured virus]
MSLYKVPSEWVPPETVPNFSEAKEIAIDLETKDDGIGSGTGPGWATKKGRVIGVALAVDGWQGYYPIAHEGGGNFDQKVFLNQLKSILELPCDKVFHNAMYDVGWLDALGLKVHGRIIDTMIAAPLINENRFNYSLKDLSKEYVGETKSEALLYEAAKEWGVDAKSEMWKLPPMYVGPYAEQDAAVTLKLWHVLQRKIIKEEVTEIFNIESELFHVLFAMKKNGVRIDIEKAEHIKTDFENAEKKIQHQLNKTCGFELEILAPLSIAKAFDKLNIKYNRTLTGLPSFDKNFLATHSNPFAQNIVKARELNKARTTFIDSILKHSYRGRIHADVNQLRSETGGTISGRLSMQNPNLQQIPARNKDIGPKIRQLFIPEKGEEWGCFDYSQQEPRILVHFTELVNQRPDLAWDVSSVKKLVDDYKIDSTDFHQSVADMAGIDRKQAKTINLGMMYGMGKGKLGSELGLDEDDTDDLWKQYHANVPFVKAMTEGTANRAKEKEFIRTLLGRKCRFHLWEPVAYGIHKPLPKKQAEDEYGPGPIRPAFTYRALNRLIQGSAADQTKKAMIDVFKEGITPLIQVHDELDISVYSEEQKQKVIEIMRDAVPLEVPSKVDCEIGPSWGEVK